MGELGDFLDDRRGDFRADRRGDFLYLAILLL